MSENKLSTELIKDGSGTMTTKCASGPSLSDSAKVAMLRKALGPLIELAERDEQQIENEWGGSRSLERLEADGELAPEILNARAAMAATK